MVRCMSSKTALGLSILAVVLMCALSLGSFAGVATAPAKAASISATGPAPLTQPQALDLSVPGSIDLQSPGVGTCAAAPAEDQDVDSAAAPKRHGFCRCSCGYPCRTSADCGGVSCDPFITCC